MSLPAGIMGVLELNDIFAHHQEHLNCITASGITHVAASWYYGRVGTERYFRLSSGASKLYYSFWYYTRMSLPAGIMGVLELSDIFAHHQEHLNCITSSGITHVCRCRLVSWACWNCAINSFII